MIRERGGRDQSVWLLFCVVVSLSSSSSSCSQTHTHSHMCSHVLSISTITIVIIQKNAKFLLEEGILDSLMYIVMPYLDKARRSESVSRREQDYARKAANCCVVLGKAYCAAVHTEGDLMLMALYERGNVPEERQLAQMLYEIPYHICRVNTNGNSDGSGNPKVTMNDFVLQQKSMPLSEDLANAIKDLAEEYR